MTPFWNPNFSPPCGQLAAPYLYAHEESEPNFRLCAQMEVLAPASYPVSRWPRLGRANHLWE